MSDQYQTIMPTAEGKYTLTFPILTGGLWGGRSDSVVMWFQGLRQRNQPREPVRPRGQSNDVRPRDQSTGR